MNLIRNSFTEITHLALERLKYNEVGINVKSRLAKIWWCISQCSKNNKISRKTKRLLATTKNRRYVVILHYKCNFSTCFPLKTMFSNISNHNDTKTTKIVVKLNGFWQQQQKRRYFVISHYKCNFLTCFPLETIYSPIYPFTTIQKQQN